MRLEDFDIEMRLFNVNQVGDEKPWVKGKRKVDTKAGERKCFKEDMVSFCTWSLRKLQKKSILQLGKP